MINLNEVDLNSETELCRIMNRFGSDKGNGWHNYTKVYDYLFKNKKYEYLNIFEVGLGTNNVNLPSNMGVNGKPGASLYGWREYFPNSNIYGADIDKDILFQSDRISTFFTDQLNSEIIKEMWSKIPETFDIIIDDGLHTFEANMNFLGNSLHKLKEDGIYIIEDIVSRSDNINNFINKLDKLNIKYQILHIPNQNNTHDNTLILIRK